MNRMITGISRIEINLVSLFMLHYMRKDGIITFEGIKNGTQCAPQKARNTVYSKKPLNSGVKSLSAEESSCVRRFVNPSPYAYSTARAYSLFRSLRSSGGFMPSMGVYWLISEI